MLRIGTVLLACAGVASANPAADVPAGIDDNGKRINAIATIDYTFDSQSSNIWREQVGAGADPNGPLPTARDLHFHQNRHTITPRIDVGIYHDTWFGVALPIVVDQSRELTLDQGVSRTSSSTVTSGFLPAAGYDAQNPGTPPGGDVMFRGVDRHGIDQLQLQLGWAPMNQARDFTKPTWKLAAELRLAVGSVMKFDPASPSGNTAIGEGVHELRVWTSFDRRIGRVEPWLELWWQTPIGTTGSSLFQNPGFGTKNTGKGMQGGARFGVELAAYEDRAARDRVGLELGGAVIGHFEGRDYSELWEVFANNSALALDADPVTSGVQPLAYPGISNIEQYIETQLTAAVRGTIGPHVRFAATFGLQWASDHAITFADAGIDQNGNNVIDSGTAEVNPLHNDKIDLVGHRYLSEDNFGYTVGLEGEVLF